MNWFYWIDVKIKQSEKIRNSAQRPEESWRIVVEIIKMRKLVIECTLTYTDFITKFFCFFYLFNEQFRIVQQKFLDL